jgi:FKBP-type peptidyl-prolyl cis-trans isomerase FkpA
MMKKYVSPALVSVAALALGCAGTQDNRSAAPQPSASVAPAPAAPATATTASAAAADQLKIIDRKIGTGKEAQVGKAAMVRYTGWLYDETAKDNKGKEFDSTANRQGLPFGFIVGVGRVIKGWDQGVVGMKVGGSRTLIVPAALAYGDKQVGNGLIPPNSKLVFDIDLVEVTP